MAARSSTADMSWQQRATLLYSSRDPHLHDDRPRGHGKISERCSAQIECETEIPKHQRDSQ
jgi:hypothetical protein